MRGTRLKKSILEARKLISESSQAAQKIISAAKNKKTHLESLYPQYTMCPDDTATAGSWAGGGLVNRDLDLLRYWWDKSEP
jgi:hypothetical protein